VTAETLRGGRNLLTPHRPGDYPGLRVLEPGEWDLALIVPEEGQTIAALGGEKVLPYRTPDGGEAQGFVLRAGDRATVVVLRGAFQMAEWRIERAG
jgi:hypothetical protein